MSSPDSGKISRRLAVLIQLLTTLVLVGILIVLAMILVELKKMTGNDFVWQLAHSYATVDINSMPAGTSSFSPLYFSSVP